MAAPSLSESEIKFVRAFLRHKVRFVVVGLSAAALQGAPIVTQDVDLWFEDLSDPGITRALREVDGAYVPPSIINPPRFAGGGLELFDIVLRMDGLGSFKTEWANCVQIALGGHAQLMADLASLIPQSVQRLFSPLTEQSVKAFLSELCPTTKQKDVIIKVC